MVDFIDKIIYFKNVKYEVKPKLRLYKTELSQILLCEETKSKEQFCIKVILSKKNNQKQIKTINTEIDILKKMKNKENIVQMYDYTFIEINNYIYCFILMEYCKYYTLLQFIDEDTILDDNIIFSIIYQIANGLKALHEIGFYHRDLRLENILLRNKNDNNVEIAICDFGSATNQIFSIDKNIEKKDNMNELLFDLCSKTNIIYRATEEIFINSQCPITEKVDIFALGIILVILLLSYVPPRYFNFQILLHSSKTIRVQIISEINNLCNHAFTELLDSVFSTDLEKRFTIIEVINFLILNQKRIIKDNREVLHQTEKIQFKEIYYKTLYEFEEQEMNENKFDIKILTRRILHGKFLNENGCFEAPDCKYIDKITEIVKQQPEKVCEFYINLFNTNVLFYNIFSIKFMFNMHYFIYNFNNKNESKFPNNIEILCPPKFDVATHLKYFLNFFEFKIKNCYNCNDILNLQDPNINNFIVNYIKFIQKKIYILQNYRVLITNDNTINAKNPEEFISKDFIFDIWFSFFLSYKIMESIPFNNESISSIVDMIFDILNKEIVSLCSILLIQLIFLRKRGENFEFFSSFIETLKKSDKFLKNLEMTSKKMNSKFKVIHLFRGENSDGKLNTFLNFINDLKKDYKFDMIECLKPESNFIKQFDYIPIKITYYEKNNTNNFNNSFYSRSNANNTSQNNSFININIVNINRNDITSSSSLSNISYSISQSNNSNQNIFTNFFLKDINSFLISQFSKPLYNFIIKPNDLKISDKLIGFGGTSEVHLGFYKGLEVAVKKVKVKDLSDNFYKEYQNEISAFTSIRHPNLIKFLGTMVSKEENESILYIVTEYCKGGSLYDLLYKKKEINIPWNLKLKFLIDISKAMIFLHKNEPQIIHHDLKSLNILLPHQISDNKLSEYISLKISDFGLSQIVSKETKNSYLKGIGSVQWMAPETLQNNYMDDINEKIDVYSFGIIIWEIYARVQPYKNMSISQVVNYVCNENGRPNCDLIKMEEMPKGLFELMKKCWDKEPNSRPDFSEILETLNDIRSLGE